MKKTILTLAAIVTGTFMAYAQYAPGDLYEKDGVPCIVLTVDESGEHGKLMSLTPSVFYVKALKKNNATMKSAAGNKKLFKTVTKDAHELQSLTNKVSMEHYVNVAPNLTKSGKENREVIKQYCDKNNVDMETNFPAQSWAASLGEDWYVAGDNELEEYSYIIGNGLGKEVYKAVKKVEELYARYTEIHKLCQETAGFENALVSNFIESSTAVEDGNLLEKHYFRFNFQSSPKIQFWFEIGKVSSNELEYVLPSHCACSDF